MYGIGGLGLRWQHRLYCGDSRSGISQNGDEWLCRNIEGLYEISGAMVRTVGREYAQQVNKRQSRDRAERGRGEAFGSLPLK
jgi:hypothetical protein